MKEKIEWMDDGMLDYHHVIPVESGWSVVYEWCDRGGIYDIRYTTYGSGSRCGCCHHIGLGTLSKEYTPTQVDWLHGMDLDNTQLEHHIVEGLF